MQNSNNNFNFTYSAPSESERRVAENIRSQYARKEETKLDALRRLDREAKHPATIFSYIFGSVGTLVLGGGMCLAMPEVIVGYMPLGIVIGILGILMVSLNYPIYKKLLSISKEKYREKIVKLADELLGKDE